jgi:hypothetical protein
MATKMTNALKKFKLLLHPVQDTQMAASDDEKHSSRRQLLDS